MKTFFAISLALFASFVCIAQNNIVVVSNGKWNSGSTWSRGHVPENGETAIIPKDSTVIVDNNMTVSSDITLKVYGNLNFQVGKLRLSANSVVLLYPGGTITSDQGNSADKIEIGGVSKYTGNQGTLEGPLMANAATSSFDFFPVTLPVLFIDFSVFWNRNTVSIKWTTTEEENISSYFVERSINGSDWDKVGAVQPSNYWSSINNYSFSDKDINGSGLVYYRIKQVDKAGQSSYTSIKSIRLQPNTVNDLEITAVANNLVITYPQNFDENVTVSLVTLSGKMVARQTSYQSNGRILFDKTNYKGHYVLLIGGREKIKISKQIFIN
jgi:hypothetical protein